MPGEVLQAASATVGATGNDDDDNDDDDDDNDDDDDDNDDDDSYRGWPKIGMPGELL